MLSKSSACSALGTKPKVILSKVGAAVVAGVSRVSVSLSSATVSSTVSSAAPPQAATTNARQSKSNNDFFTIFLR